MNYEKNVLILKQHEGGFSTGKSPVGGILRIEKENDESMLFLSVINASGVSEGQYLLFIIDGENNFLSFDLGKKPISLRVPINKPFNAKGGFSGGVCFVKNDLPVIVAFGSTNDDNDYMSEFRKHVADYCYENYKLDGISNADKTCEYNDEAVATENYFDFKENIKDDLQYENGVPFNGEQIKSRKGGEETFGFYDEKNTAFGKECKTESYYQTVKSELNNIFEKFPSEKTLSKCFPDSKWAKVSYGEDKYYVVGLIKENKKAKYICYGVPSGYSEKAPKELDGYCSFIPLSVFETNGKGYWMMFQDAVTGECLKKKTND